LKNGENKIQISRFFGDRKIYPHGVYLEEIRYITSRKLQKSCGCLLVLLAVCDIVYATGALTPFVSMLGGWRMPLMTCFIIEAKTTAAIMFSYYFMFFLSVDRLLAVLAPFWYIFIIVKYCQFTFENVNIFVIIKYRYSK
jgi:hypothetical protein